MADRKNDRRLSVVAPHSMSSYSGGLTAAAQLVSVSEQRRPVQTDWWQEEAWDFYENLGEFNYGVEWFAEALSRVRLGAAKMSPGGDEPEMITEGPIADLVSSFAGGTDGQAALLRSLGVQLSVPGECYVVGRQATQEDYELGFLLDAPVDENGNAWSIQPVNTMKRSQRNIKTMLGRESRGWEMRVDDAIWRNLPAESLICRVWDRNERWPWRAMAPSKPALPIMREIDMYNRHIIATLVSRVALNGMMLIPDEVVLPVNEQYENAVDPFIAELIDIMMQAIKNPGSPAAAMPMPMRIPAEYIEKIKHFTFATPLDARLFEHRQQALNRLATTLNLPSEIMTGLGDVNHWSAWQLTEDAIKIHISPKAEIVTRCLTTGYFHPMMRSAGLPIVEADGTRYLMWYDVSELTQRPDRSEAARLLHSANVISDEAARRENGFDEADAPDDAELEKMLLRILAVNPQTAAPALQALLGVSLDMALAAPPPPVTDPVEASGPVGTGDAKPPGPAGSVTGSPNNAQPKTQSKPAPAPDESARTASATPRPRLTVNGR